MHVVCAPRSDLGPYLRILRWFLEDGETLRVLGFPDQLDALGPISAILGGAKEKLAAAMDKTGAKTLVAVTEPGRTRSPATEQPGIRALGIGLPARQWRLAVTHR